MALGHGNNGRGDPRLGRGQHPVADGMGRNMDGGIGIVLLGRGMAVARGHMHRIVVMKSRAVPAGGKPHAQHRENGQQAEQER